MIVLAPEEMRRVDVRAVQAGIPELILMEIAGRGVAEKARLILEGYNEDSEHDHAQEMSPMNRNGRGKTVVIAGKGNNGGDGLTAARYLDMWGYDVKILMISPEDELKGSSLVNYKICRLREMDIVNLTVDSKGNFERIENYISGADILIDALFGTGIKGSVKEPYRGIIKSINNFAGTVLSVDIPSGIDGETGEVLGNAVYADYTITMAYPKIGLLVFPGREYCGEIEVVDLGVPEEFALEQNPAHFVLDDDEALALLPPRLRDSHKGSYGSVGIVGGKSGMSGAPSLAGLAALKTGAGLVRVLVPEDIQSIVAAYSAELMTMSLKSKEDSFSVEDQRIVEELMDNSTVIAVGPGLGYSARSTLLVNRLLEEYQGPLVIDADGINSINDLDLLKKRKAPLVLTPHPGEMARLTGKNTKEIQADRINTARSFALQYELFLVLKGAATVIAFPDGKVYINPTGNEGMATAGSGDVLTGMMAGLLAGGMKTGEAAVLAPYLHGLAGDLALDELTSYSMTAGDIISHISTAIKYLVQG